MTEKKLILGIKKLLPTAKLPKKAYKTDAGFDLFAAKKTIINSQSEKAISTGLAVEIPKGYFGLIKIRSGLSINQHLTESAGVIDSDYRGTLKVVLVNYTYAPKTIEEGEKIAQLIILPVPEIKIVIKKELSKTERNKNGFGSTS